MCMYLESIVFSLLCILEALRVYVIIIIIIIIIITRNHRRMGIETLSQLDFSRESDPISLIEEIPMGQWSCKKKKNHL